MSASLNCGGVGVPSREWGDSIFGYEGLGRLNRTETWTEVVDKVKMRLSGWDP